MIKSTKSTPDNLLLEDLVRAICQRGWRTPAIFLLEAGRPLAFLGGQLLWIAQPALALFISAESIGRLAHLLEDSEAVESLLSRLERNET